MQSMSFPELEPMMVGFGYNDVPIRSKVAPLEELVTEFVDSGCSVHFPWLSSRGSATLFEIIRQCRAGRLRDLTIISASLRAELGLLIGSGGVGRLITAFAATSYPSIRSNDFLTTAVRDGDVALEEWSMLSLAQRMLAGALGWPFVPSSTLDGTDLPAGVRPADELATLVDAASGATHSVMPALRPDVVLIHCPIADWDGNGVLFPPYAEDVYSAYGSRRGVILTAEQIVPPSVLRRWSSHVRVPAARVLGVAQVPFGAHPASLHVPIHIEGISGYGEDYDFFREMGSMRTMEDVEVFAKRWVDVSSRNQYLAQLGRQRIEHLLVKDFDESWRADRIDMLGGDGPDERQPAEVIRAGERLAVCGARAMADLVADAGARTVVAGAGVASLAAGLGCKILGERGGAVDLLYESGVVGYVPRPHDSTLSNSRNLPTARQLTNTLEALGMLVPSSGESMVALLSAGQIGEDGTCNSNRTTTGKFLVGGGGSTDIARHVRTIVVLPAKAGRFTDLIDFVTYWSPEIDGIATDAGFLVRESGEFALAGWFADLWPDGESALRHLREVTGWDLQLAAGARALDPPTADELAYLNAIDPDANLLG